MSLTPEQINEAWHMRTACPKTSWVRIGLKLGFSDRTVREALYPERREARRANRRKRENGHKKPKGYHRYEVSPHGVHMEGRRATVPSIVLIEREARLALAPRSLTALICGDPPPGRSALDKRNA
jgi:hypothetical protein